MRKPTETQQSNWLNEMMFKRARKCYEEGDLESALDHVCVVNYRYPKNKKARMEFGRYLREYIDKNGGIPDKKVARLYNAKLFPMEPKLEEEYELTIHGVLLKVVVKTNELFSTTIMIVELGDTTITKVRITNAESKDVESSEVIINAIIPPYNDLTIFYKTKTDPTKFILVTRQKRGKGVMKIPIICYEKERRLVVLGEEPFHMELRKMDGTKISAHQAPLQYAETSPILWPHTFSDKETLIQIEFFLDYPETEHREELSNGDATSKHQSHDKYH